MNPALILVGIVLVPVLVLLVLRINAALVFLSLCLGDVLVQFVGGQQLITATGRLPVHSSSTNLKLILLWAPVVLTALFMIRTVRGSRLLLNILPAAGVGLLGALLTVPLLPAGTAVNVLSSPLWQQVKNAQALVVGAAAVLCLVVLWLQRPKTGGEGKHGHKAH